MKFVTTKLFVAALTALTVSGAAFAAGGGMKDRPDFATLDADGSGEVSLEEMNAHAQARFAENDTDGNGEISLEEMAAHHEGRGHGEKHGAMMEVMFKGLDADGSGGVSFEEMSAMHDHATMFAELDADGSGGLTKDEMRAGHGMRGGYGGGMKDCDGQGRSSSN